MSQEILKTILMSLDNPLSVSFTLDDVCGWPDGARSVLESTGILKRGGNAQSITCNGCGEGCLEDVVFSQDRDGNLTAYVICREKDNIGRVRVAPERLRTWVVSLDGLAAWLAGELGDTAEEFIPGRLWLIGRVEIRGVRSNVLLARGLGWPDGDRVLREALSQKRSQAAVVLVPARASFDGSPETVSLDEVLCLDGDGLHVDVSAIREAASRAQAASAVGAGGRPEGCRYLFKEGVDTWAIVYDGVEVSPPLKDTKGLHYLSFLLAHPSREGHYALDIVHEVYGTPYEPDEVHTAMSAVELDEQGLRVSGFTDAGEIMDAEYEQDCRKRLKEAQEKLKRAEAGNDTTLIREAKNDIEQYRRALNEGIGLSGRHRATGSAAERARVAVTQAIRRVLKKLQNQHSALYEHLSSPRLKTGMTCSYNPTAPIDWNFF